MIIVIEFDGLNAEHGAVGETWAQIVACCHKQGLTATRQTLQTRVTQLYDAYKSRTMGDYRRSGTEDEYSERERLLDELIKLENDHISREAEVS